MSEENLQHSECQTSCLTLSIIKMNHETTKVRLKNYRLSKNIWFQILLHKQDILNKRTQEMTVKIERALLNYILVVKYRIQLFKILHQQVRRV